MPWTWDSPSPAESMEHMDDKILQKINESYVQSLMKMMSSKVLKELRAENETIQQHLGALTSDVHLLASQLASRKEDKSWHHEAKLEALREELHLGAAREKELVAELGQLKRLVEGRHEDLLAHHRHLDKDLRTALRELRSDASEVQRDSLNSLQDVRSSLRDLRSDLEEQREALKSLQETDFLKQLGDARQALADLQEERQWHEDAMKQLRDSHQDQQMRRQADSADLDQRVEGFRQMLESTLPNDELEKRHQVLTQHMEQLMAQLEKNRRKDKEELKEKFDQLQQHSEGRMEECLDRARLLDQDILDKLNPELLNIKDHEQRLSESVNQLMDRIPGLAIGEMQVQEECQIFRSDIGKLSEEILRIDESLRHIMPWVDWLRDNQPAMDSLQTYVEERLAALLPTHHVEEFQILATRLGRWEEQQRCANELHNSWGKLAEDFKAQSRRLLGFEVQQRKYLQQCEDFRAWRQELDAVRVRLKRIEVNQVQEQKNQKVWQENFSKCRKACEDIYAKCHQEMERRSQQSSEEHRYMKDCEDQYSKWRESAVAWQQQQMRRLGQ
ncbi:unnamed protein product [Durusdinium trenchii]|uniref:Uncharacterized protein n=1 Tax=Durusdinium trenchii TaxID=1381693 RepID=A0ABP0JFR0_9DINO